MKFERAIERDAEEFGESMAMAMVMSNLMQRAFLAASKKFDEEVPKF